MPIRVICVGKAVAPWLEPSREYEKRLSRFDRLEVVEVPALKEPASGSEALEKELRRKEGEQVLRRLNAGEHVVALSIGGEEVNSQQFASRLQALRVAGKTPCFVIGGSLGLSPEVEARADWRLSLGKMTYPHQMARVVLLEQLYRCFKILSGERYHK